MAELFTQLAQQVLDQVFALIPQPRPSVEALQRCKLVAHRGAHDCGAKENTLAAFAKVLEVGAAGIEFDVRWTRDLVPVILHDSCATRVFGKALYPARVDFATLRRELPEVPSLQEVVTQFGGKLHFIIELKHEPFPDLARQKDILQKVLAPLRPKQDYHLLTLTPSVFEAFDNFPKNCYSLVSMLNAKSLSKVGLAQGWGGFAGHFLLLSDNIAAQHRAAGQWVGTGFMTSVNCLKREINRGMDWIFTNQICAMQRALDELKKTAR